MPSPLDLADLPFLREALVEVVLLAAAGGLLSAWIVLRRLAFFTHATGSATFPGLVVADASGVSPLIAGVAVALGYAGGVERAGRAGREPSEATALLLVAALAGGVVLASDVFESGAAVDRLLFGTLLGLETADLALSAATVALAARGVAGARPHLGRDRVRPRRRHGARTAGRARRLPAARAGRGGRGGRHPGRGSAAGGRDLRAAAAAARLVARSIPALLAWSLAFALAEGLVGLYAAYWLDLPPGPPVAVLGALTYAVLALGTGVREARLGAATA